MALMLVTMCHLPPPLVMHAGKVTIVPLNLQLHILSRFHVLKELTIQLQVALPFPIASLVRLEWCALTLVKGRFKQD
jgi:hypothetical protein